MNEEEIVRAYAPGRVNLIGEYTDFNDGFVLPMAINRGTTVSLKPGGEAVELRSEDESEAAVVPLDVESPEDITPEWAKYIAGVVVATRPMRGGKGTVSTDLPIGAGLSSSAALEVAVALALGFEGSVFELAQACQNAEQIASGVPCGIMDQLASAASREGSALLIDCRSLELLPVNLPTSVDILVVHSGQERRVAGSAYAERRASCEAAADLVGPLRDATLQQVRAIDDEILRKRARHVVTENQRVLAFIEALESNDLPLAGELMNQSHFSLRDDFEVSTTVLDSLTERLRKVPGVYGARLTGAGFGGCVVAMIDKDCVIDEGWRFVPSAGAALL